MTGEPPSPALAVERHDLGLLEARPGRRLRSSPVPHGGHEGSERFQPTVICLTLQRRKTCEPLFAKLYAMQRGSKCAHGWLEWPLWLGLA